METIELLACTVAGAVAGTVTYYLVRSLITVLLKTSSR